MAVKLTIYEEHVPALTRWSLVLEPMMLVDSQGAPIPRLRGPQDFETMELVRKRAAHVLMNTIPGRERAGKRARLWLDTRRGLYLIGDWRGHDGGWEPLPVEPRQRVLEGSA